MFAITKSKKSFSIIFFLASVAFLILSVKYFIDSNPKTTQRKPAKQPIQREERMDHKPYHKHHREDNKKLDYKEVLLKQQLQIADLQEEIKQIKTNLSKIKINDSLSKIILTFVRLEDLILSGQNYSAELQKLKLLAKSDFALSIKINNLKSALDVNPKINEELMTKFNQILPEIKLKQDEIANKDSWLQKPKAFISSFIKIKRTDGKDQKTNLEVSITKIQRDIEKQEYDQALHCIKNLDPAYQELLTELKHDLRDANNLEKSLQEIHRYLKALTDY